MSKSKLALNTLIPLWLVTSIFTSLAFAIDDFSPITDRSCSLNILPSHSPVSEINYGSISSAVAEKNLLLKDVPVKSQGSYGCCWISATLARWERETLIKFGTFIPLSENHMVLASLFYRIEEGIYYGSDITAGGWAHASEWMAAKVGLVPESVWKPKIDIRDKGVGKETLAYLNSEIATFQNELASMKAKGKTDREAWLFAQSKKSELFKYMRERFGNFPSSFKVNGMEYTPNSFSKKIIGKGDGKFLYFFEPIEERLSKPVASIATKEITTDHSLFTLYPGADRFLPVTKNKLNAKNQKLEKNLYKLYFRSRKDTYSRLKSEMKTIHKEVVESLENGNPVHFSTWMVPDYYTRSTGVMSIKGHDGTLELAKGAKVTGGHALLITGVYRDVENSIVGYRIQNSWSAANGDVGYFYMDVDYFEAFMIRIGVYKKPD